MLYQDNIPIVDDLLILIAAHVSLPFKVRTWLLSIIGVQNPKEEAVESRRKYDFGDEVLAWRIKLRKEW